MALVSIWITTYNHEPYIAQAIESVLMQQTSFDYELIIGEDCSSDRTREIVKDYKKRYPDKIRLFLPEQNLGMVPMFKATYSLCTGRYVAWLDGDDYWTDPLKLQKQVDFMEANPDFVLCFHKVTYIDQIKNSRSESQEPSFMGMNGILTSEHFVFKYNPVDTPSVLHRNILGKNLPEWYYALPFPDLAFYLLLLQHGKAKYISDNMCVYRIHRGGAWSGQSEYINYSKLITLYSRVSDKLPYLQKQNVSKLISYYQYKLLELDLKQKDFKNAFINLKKVLRKHPHILLDNRSRLLSILLRKLSRLPISFFNKSKVTF